MSSNDYVFIGEAIEALCEHYKDDPRTFVIQVGVLGFWGEWHTFPREDWAPNASTKRTILNTYLKSLGADGLTQVFGSGRVFPEQFGALDRVVEFLHR